jgi:predicted  nucleic acid-binding Zn-ribbon protein
VTRISSLFRLQTLDSQMDTHQSRLDEIEDRLRVHPELDRARAEETAANDLLESARKALRHAEAETHRQQQRIADTEKTLYSGSVRQPKELQELQEEGASLRRFLAVLEERQLQAMMQYEEAEQAASAARGAREERERERAQEELDLRAEQARQQSSLATLTAQREAALSAVSADDLKTYNTLRNAKRGLAVVRLEDGSCTGCGVAPSRARIDLARSGQELVQCGNCGRILYLG